MLQIKNIPFQAHEYELFCLMRNVILSFFLLFNIILEAIQYE